MKVFAIVVLACAVSEVGASGCFGLFKKPIPDELTEPNHFDFQGLNRYIWRKFKSGRGIETLGPKEALDRANDMLLDTLRSGVDQLNGDVRRAADLFIALSDVRECDENVLSLLRKAKGSNLDPRGHSRLETAARYMLPKVVDICARYVDYSVERMMLSLSPAMKRFIDIVNPFHLTGFSLDYSTRNSWESHEHYYAILDDNTSRLMRVGQLSKVMEELADGAVKGEQRDEQAINKYLMDPCKQVDQTFGNIFEGTNAMAALSQNQYGFIDRRSTQFRRLAWTYRACGFILSRARGQRVTSISQLSTGD